MGELLDSLFRSDYMPHGHCYWWKPEILWLNVISDVLIAFAYFSIPIAIYYFVRKRKDLEFKGIFILFSLFILLCGITHLVSIFVIWHGIYGVHGLTKLATAIVSCATAYHVYKSIPMALQFPSVNDVQHALEKANAERVERLKVEHQRQQDIMLRESTDSAHIGILVIAKDGTILVANEAAVSIFDYTKEELEGENVTKLISADQKDEYTKLLKQIASNGGTVSSLGAEKVLEGRTKSGAIIPIETRHDRREFSNQPVIFISFQDISERLASQRALLEIENMTSSIIDSLPVGLQVWELRGEDLYLTRFNQAAVSILNIEFEKLLGMRLEEAFPDVIGSEIPEAYTKVAREGGTWVDQSHAYNDGVISGIFDLTCFQSNPNTAIVLFDDITDKHMAQKALKEKDLFIKAAFDASVTGVYINNLETGLNEFINQSYTDITGYEMSDIQSMQSEEFALLFHPDDRPRFRQHLNDIKYSSDPDKGFEVEFRFKHKQGHWIWCWSKDVVFDRDQQGNARLFMGSFLDISPLKEMQSNLVKLKDSAEKANAAKSEFLANMSHEIRTPMNAILGLTRLVLDMELGEKQAQYLSSVEASSKSLLNVLNDILDFSKMEAGKLEIVNETFQLEELVESSVGLFSLIAEEKNLELVVEMDPQLDPFYISDPMRLNQILNNLIGNAIKFTDEGYIHISVDVESQNGLFLRFKVMDSGIGMTKEQSAKLFASFSQGDTSVVRKYGGTGLGLSISKGLANLMGGEITVESELGQGSTFCLIVPVEASSRTAKDFDQPIRPMSTLLVEDNEATQICLSSVLAGWGFDVEVCNDGKEALALLKQRKKQNKLVELLIVDWKIPELNGLELLKVIEEDPEIYGISDQTLVIVATAFGSHHATKHAKNLKVDAFLDKPILNSRLNKTIQFLQSDDSIKATESKSHDRDISLQKYTSSLVMLVEDIKTNQLVATEFLKRFGIEPVIAENGQEAVELFKRQEFDLILMDLQMPVMDGISATREIRSLEEGASVPIIAMSAAVMESDVARVKSAGMNGHIAKPIDLKKLAEALNKWLKKDMTEQPSDFDTDLAIEEKGLTGENWPAGFAAETAIIQLGNDAELYKKLLASFHHEFKNAPSKIADMWEHKQFEQLKLLAHSLKGVARTLGAKPLYELSRIVESSSDIIESSTIQDFKAQLTQDIASVAVTLVDNAPDYQALKKTPLLSEDNSGDLLSELLKKLEDGLFVNMEALNKDLPNLAKLLSETEFNQLVHAIENLDYRSAIAILKTTMAAK